MIDAEWENFVSSGGDHIDLQTIDTYRQKKRLYDTDMVGSKASELYTFQQNRKLVYLNKTIDLNDVFWKLPIIVIHLRKTALLKTDKFNSSSQKKLML